MPTLPFAPPLAPMLARLARDVPPGDYRVGVASSYPEAQRRIALAPAGVATAGGSGA